MTAFWAMVCRQNLLGGASGKTQERMRLTQQGRLSLLSAYFKWEHCCYNLETTVRVESVR